MSCADERSADGECAQQTIAERALRGTWVADELRLAEQNGYEFLEIFEVYQYAVTLYDPQTVQGGLFAEYIDNF